MSPFVYVVSPVPPFASASAAEREAAFPVVFWVIVPELDSVTTFFQVAIIYSLYRVSMLRLPCNLVLHDSAVSRFLPS